MAFKVDINRNVQYASREAGVKAHAEDYSFNIESELFQQLTPEQQKLWRKEIEQAVVSGGHCGLNLAKDKRYDEKPVSEDLEEVIRKYEQRLEKENPATEAYDFASAIRFGVNWQKEQLLAKAFDFTKEHNIACVLASECLRNHGWFSRERDFNDLFCHLSCVDKLFEGKFSGKTKVIVIKED